MYRKLFEDDKSPMIEAEYKCVKCETVVIFPQEMSVFHCPYCDTEVWTECGEEMKKKWREERRRKEENEICDNRT